MDDDRYEINTVRDNSFWARLNTYEWRCRTCDLIVPQNGPFKHTCCILVQGDLLVQAELFPNSTWGLYRKVRTENEFVRIFGMVGMNPCNEIALPLTLTSTEVKAYPRKMGSR